MIQVLSFGNESANGNGNAQQNGSNNQPNAQSAAASTAATPSESLAPIFGRSLLGTANGAMSSASETHLNLASSNFGGPRGQAFSSSVIDFSNASNINPHITGSVDSGAGSRADSIGRPKIRKSPSDDSLRLVQNNFLMLLSARKRVPCSLSSATSSSSLSFVVYVISILF